MTPEQQKEFIDRRNLFLEKYKKLIEEMQCDFISYPQFIPNKQGTFEIRITNDILDKKYTSTEIKSPFV